MKSNKQDDCANRAHTIYRHHATINPKGELVLTLWQWQMGMHYMIPVVKRSIRIRLGDSI